MALLPQPHQTFHDYQTVLIHTQCKAEETQQDLLMGRCLHLEMAQFHLHLTIWMDCHKMVNFVFNFALLETELLRSSVIPVFRKFQDFVDKNTYSCIGKL